MTFFGTSVASDETSIVVHNLHKNRNNQTQTPLIRARELCSVPQSRPRSVLGRSKHLPAPPPDGHRKTKTRSWRSFLPNRKAPFWLLRADISPGIPACIPAVYPPESLPLVQVPDS